MNVPIIYLYFHSKILNWKGKEINEKEFKTCFFQWRIPKNLRLVILKEMEKYKLLKIEKKRPYNIIHLNNFYLNEEDFKIDNSYKDKDTKDKTPYKKMDNLKCI